MFIQRNTKRVKDKVYHSTLLTQSYREDGKVKHRVISNLSKWPEELVEQLDLLLKGGKVTKLTDIKHKQGKAYGAIKVIYEISKRLGIAKALGKSEPGILSLFMIMGRIINNGSRLALCNWAKDEAIDEVLGLSDFNEDHLYKALDWLCEKQSSIEHKLFKMRHTTENPKELFLYDVTSSYLEGTQNELANWGYNRDKKRGKKQIVIGLLTDNLGVPVSVEVFKGNTLDPQTVFSQIKKLSANFGVEKVIFVGDRGMIKSQQIKDLNTERWHYITAITKAQIGKLINDGVLQLGLFDENLCEVERDSIRYILRRNPERAKEIERNRKSKITYVSKKIAKKNTYISEHPKASIKCATRDVKKIVTRLKLKGIIEIDSTERKLTYKINKDVLKEKSKLDGCYVIKTDVPSSELKKETVHDRYKDLTEVEKAFRTIKTGLLEIRPLYLRKESRTRGYVFICMLSYMVTKYIWDELKFLNIQQKFIYQTLDKIQYIIYPFKTGKIKALPSNYTDIQTKILSALDITFPKHL